MPVDDREYREITVGWETPCPNREDKTHCVHWWDGEECCNCHAPADDTKDTKDTE